MTNRIDHTSNTNADNLSHSSSLAAYFHEASNRRQLSRPAQFDELIGSLADAYENQRARQVVEWEQLVRERMPQIDYRVFL